MALRSAWKVVKSAESKKLLGHSKMMEWSVYIIRCRDRAFYTGISTDVQRRFGEHISGGRTAAKYTKFFASTEPAYEITIGPMLPPKTAQYRGLPVAVGMPIARHPPHGSVRERLSHTALTSGQTRMRCEG